MQKSKRFVIRILISARSMILRRGFSVRRFYRSAAGRNNRHCKCKITVAAAQIFSVSYRQIFADML